MYDFHYNYFKPKHKSKAQLLFTDTDSLMHEYKKDDYKDIKRYIKTKFDTSNYPENHKGIKQRVNKKIIGMKKDEPAGDELVEFVGLRAKLYAYETDNSKTSMICKGVKKLVVKDITFDHYIKYLFEGHITMRKMNVIKSQKHQMYTETINKVALTGDDDKRVINSNNIHTLANGYKNIDEYIYI